jgi:hypothetical protein
MILTQSHGDARFFLDEESEYLDLDLDLLFCKLFTPTNPHLGAQLS